MTDIVLWILVALNVLNMIITPFIINKPRSPVGPAMGAWLIVSSTIWIMALLDKLT
jgi:hypothetical protein